jgi:hypothetical protein
MIEAGRESLILRRASATRSSGQWNDDDFDVLPMAKLLAASSKWTPRRIGSPWMTEPARA